MLVYTIKELCRTCYTCVRECPAKAIRIDRTDNDVIVVFTDSGIGILPDDMENLFTEFVRIKNEKTKNISGSGLGLSIVKKVIELYQGTIKVESTPDIGSIFAVRLPKKVIKIPELK